MVNEHRFMIDCGEGTQRQLARSVGLVDVDAIFLTHYHADHWLGVPGLLKTFDLRERDRDLQLFGPPGLKRMMAMIEGAVGSTRYRVVAEELEAGDAVEFPGFAVDAMAVRHRGASFGYAVVEPDRPGRIDLERAAAAGLAPGPDLGRLQRGEPVNGITPADVMGPDRPGRRVVLSGDTSPCDAIREAAWRADLLVHEATFLDEDLERARDTHHTTAREAAELAAEARVRLLALTHVSMRASPRLIEEEARAIHPSTVVPRDLDLIEVPYREKGEAVLVKNGGRDAA